MSSLIKVVGSNHASAHSYYSALRGLCAGNPVFFDPSLDGLVVTTFEHCAEVLMRADFAKSRPLTSGAVAGSELDAVMQSHFGAQGGSGSAARRRYWARRISSVSSTELGLVANEAMASVGGADFDLNRDVLRGYVLRAALLACGIRIDTADVAAALDIYVGHLDGRVDGVPPLEMYQAYVRLLTLVAGASPFTEAELAGHGYRTAQEWVVDVAFVLAAAQESTAFLLGSILIASRQFDVDFEAQDSDRLIAEGLRFDSPVQLVGRYASDDTTIAGVPVAAGTRVFCHIGLASRDPARFDDPDRFDPSRPNALDALAFGAGRWGCIGQAIARTEARVMLTVLQERATAIHIHAEGVRYERASAAREFKSLPCTLVATHQ